MFGAQAMEWTKLRTLPRLFSPVCLKKGILLLRTRNAANFALFCLSRHFTGTAGVAPNGFTLDITYHLTVQPKAQAQSDDDDGDDQE